MAGWFPTGSLTTIYALVLLASVVVVLAFGKKSFRDIALVMFASWLIARTSTHLSYFPLQIIGTIGCAFYLTRISSLAANIIIGLFTLKLAVYILYIISKMHVEAMWAMSESFAYLQIAVMVFGGIYGNSKWLGSYRAGDNNSNGRVLPNMVSPQKRAKSKRAS